MGQIVRSSDVYVEPYVFSGVLRGGIEADKAHAFGRLKTVHMQRDIPGPRCPVEERPIEGTSLYAGPVWNHFGHIMVDSVHRLWPLLERRFDRIVFTGVIGLRGVNTAEDLAKAPIPRPMLELLDLLDLTDVPIHLVRKPQIFADLVIPEPGSAWMEGARPFYAEALRAYQQKIQRKSSKLGATPTEIYYSRSHILAGAGGIIGLSHLAENMEARGFETVRPEELSLAKQFAYLLNARTVVFDEGSAVHPIELLSDLRGRFFMFPRRPKDRVFSPSFRDRASLEILTDDGNVVQVPDRYGRMGPAALTFYRDPAPVFATLSRLGFVGGAFDRAGFLAREKADLAACNASTDEIQAERESIIERARNPEPVAASPTASE